MAGKTGTKDVKDDIISAWFVAYTPQISTAVMYVAGDDGNGDLDGFARPGDSTFFGGTYPALTWADYMQTAMEDLPVEDFDEPAYVNRDAADAAAAADVLGPGRRRAVADRGARRDRGAAPTEEPTEEPSTEPSEEPSEPPATEEPSPEPAEPEPSETEQPTTEPTESPRAVGDAVPRAGGETRRRRMSSPRPVTAPWPTGRSTVAELTASSVAVSQRLGGPVRPPRAARRAAGGTRPGSPC